MRVPDRARRVDSHESHTAFHQTPRQQATLPDRRAAIAIPQRLGFGPDIKRLLHLRRFHDPLGFHVEVIARRRDSFGVPIAESLIHLLYQPAPVGDCLPIYVYGKVQVVHPEIRRIGIGSHPEWRIGAAEKAGAHGVVQHGIQDIGWHAFAQPQFLRHHCAKRWEFHRLDGQVTRHQKVNAIEVDRGPAPNRAQDRELVHLRCDLGQMLADLDS